MRCSSRSSCSKSLPKKASNTSSTYVTADLSRHSTESLQIEVDEGKYIHACVLESMFEDKSDAKLCGVKNGKISEVIIESS